MGRDSKSVEVQIHKRGYQRDDAIKGIESEVENLRATMKRTTWDISRTRSPEKQQSTSYCLAGIHHDSEKEALLPFLNMRQVLGTGPPMYTSVRSRSSAATSSESQRGSEDDFSAWQLAKYSSLHVQAETSVPYSTHSHINLIANPSSHLN